MIQSKRIPPRPPAELWLEPPASRGADTEHACRIEFPDGQSNRVWFRFPAAQRPLITERTDPFIVAVLLKAMRRACDLIVHGPVSGGLISNLNDFQEAYSAYHPGLYSPVRIEADRVIDTPAFRPRRALSAFSGGVDSAFTLFRHTTRSKIVPKRPLCAALLMHGMDLPLDQAPAFARAAQTCRAVTNDAGIELHTGSTNVRELRLPWEDQFGTAVAASLMFFQEAYTFGLVPSVYTYDRLHPDHGSNPVTDPLLSGPLFTIVHDGAAYGRIDKLRELAAWPAALANLRVCWQPGRSDNCGRCEKCVRTRLMMDLNGIDTTGGFPEPLLPADLEHLVINTTSGLNELAYLLGEARAKRPKSPWIAPLSRAIARNKRYLGLQRIARNSAGTVPGWLRTSAGFVARRFFAQGDPDEKEPDAPQGTPQPAKAP